MTTQMQMHELKFVPEDHPNTQKVAVLHKPYEISIIRAEIPEPGEGEVRVKIKCDSPELADSGRCII